MNEYFDSERFIEDIPKILPQLSVTFSIVGISIFLGTILGIIVAVLRIKNIPILHQILGIYISFMRGTPLLVQMMIAFYGIPLLIWNLFQININDWSPVVFVDIAFILNEGAFLGEIFRSSILAVDSIQTEAGYSIGMTKTQTFLRIVLPQSIRMILPSYGVDIIGVFQNTSLVFTVGGVLDIMGRAKTIGIATGHTLEAYLVVAFTFVIISLILRFVFYLINEKIRYESKIKVDKRKKHIENL